MHEFTFLGKVACQEENMVYYIYTDGSYKEIPGVGRYAAAASTITPEGASEPIAVLSKVFSGDILSMHNVAGEITAVMQAMDYCLKDLRVKHGDVLVICYDYQGIEAWCKRVGEAGYWRAKNKWTQAYRNYVLEKVKTVVEVQFKHVKGHTGNAGNEYVDTLARNALEQHFIDIQRRGS